jgi:hypothetical protein
MVSRLRFLPGLATGFSGGSGIGFGSRRIRLAVCHVMLAGHGVQLRDAQPGQQLAFEIERFRFGEVGDVARVNRQCRLDRHCVDNINRLFERARNVRIGFLFKADMRVADLQEQGRAGCR